MTESVSHVYKVLKGAWGVRISITARALHGVEGDGPSVLPDGAVWLARSPSARRLDAWLMDGLEQGLVRARPELLRELSGRVLTIEIEDVSFVETDFQVEGLPAAMCAWLEAVLNVEIPAPVVTFHRALNRYEFDWE